MTNDEIAKFRALAEAGPMSLNEIKNLAQAVVDWADHQQREYNMPDSEMDRLARAVLDMLPVVRAAEAWEVGRRSDDGIIPAVHALEEAVDTLRARLKGR